MNIRIASTTAAAVALAAVLGASPAMAQEGSTLTREQVKAEALQARANGTLNAVAGEASDEQRFWSTRDRNEVKAEVAEARARGQLVEGDAYGYEVDRTVSPAASKSRAEVKADLMAAIKAGDLHSGETY